MPEKGGALAEGIAQLAGHDARQREEAARELFRRGCAAAEPVLRNWFADREFRALVRSGCPLLTVGVAVEPARFEEIHQRFAGTRLAKLPPDQDAHEFELDFGNGVRVDILTTRDPAGGGAIARFLARFGEGIQQVECEVLDLARATQLLRTRFALQPVYPEAREGANGTRVNFFLVPTVEEREERKVLVELVEVPPKTKRK